MAVITTVIIVSGLVVILNPPKAGEGLTDEQRLEILDDCIQHPDALRCR